MLTVRPASERGVSRIGWLESHHTFSFSGYFDRAHMGFRTLRVINDDRVRPGMGFGTHPHNDMEILSYVLEGALQHKDSMGNGSLIVPGEVQRMSAGTGVAHSEFNPSRTDPVHFLQIWIRPDKEGLEPGYEQKVFAPEAAAGRLQLLASDDGRDGSVTLHQDAALLRALLRPGDRVAHALAPGRAAWVQVARGGGVSVNGARLTEGDGAAIEGETQVLLGADGAAEVLLFDLA